MAKILLAEDDTDMRRFLVKALQNAGFDVISYDNGMSAYQRLREEPFELLLTDIVLGDRYGTSCVPAIAETIESVLRGRGYVVSRNKPYAGGFITEHYGNPAVGLHAIQLELNRALYMDERRYERTASFQSVAADLELLADELAAIPVQELRPYRAAAE